MGCGSSATVGEGSSSGNGREAYVHRVKEVVDEQEKGQILQVLENRFQRNAKQGRLSALAPNDSLEHYREVTGGLPSARGADTESIVVLTAPGSMTESGIRSCMKGLSPSSSQVGSFVRTGEDVEDFMMMSDRVDADSESMTLEGKRVSFVAKREVIG